MPTCHVWCLAAPVRSGPTTLNMARAVAGTRARRETGTGTTAGVAIQARLSLTVHSTDPNTASTASTTGPRTALPRDPGGPRDPRDPRAPRALRGTARLRDTASLRLTAASPTAASPTAASPTAAKTTTGTASRDMARRATMPSYTHL